MNDQHKSTRLGDLLVERGLINRSQLAHAIELQQIRRQHAIEVNDPNGYTQQFGELLIELGFINRNQLKSSLSWQRRLRKATAMMVFVAPLLTAACGGGGGSGGTNPNNTPSSTSSSQNVSAEQLSSTPRDNSLSSSSPASSAPGSVSGISSSAVSSSSVIPALTSSSFSSQASSISSASSSSTPIVSGAVSVKWTPPSKRENGEFLDITEVGGYELRYKRKSEDHYTSIIINDGYIDTYHFENLQGEYEFEVAAFDVVGLYSVFVTLQPI